jgi:hypothetical protein
MKSGRLENSIPAEHFYPNVQSAVDAYLSEQQES